MQENTTHLPKGYMGKVLSVDLSTQTFQSEPLDDDLAARFLGGRGLGIAFLFRHFAGLEHKGRYHNAFAEVDPLSPDNPLIITTAPTTGTKMPTSGRFHANFKSPLTGGVGSSDSGGYWGVTFKKSGYDVLSITGKAETPVYLVISSDGVEFHAAERFREANTKDTTDTLAAELPKGTRFLTIGQAGKLGAYFASITNDKGRSLGRGGGGIVFGAKNLYAIAVVPDRSQPIEVADEESLDFKNESGAAFKAKIKLDVGKLSRKEEHYGSLSSMGSLCLCGMVNNYGQLVHNNMQDTSHTPEDVEHITGEALRQHAANAKAGETKVKVKKSTCYNCPILCKRKTQLVDGEGRLLDEGEGPEFETVALLGANLSIYNLPVIVQANYWANRYGLDTISLGGTIAACIELYELVKSKGDAASAQEKHLLEDMQDFVAQYGEPAFGNADALIPFVHEIGNLRGIGQYLALGSYRFCQRYGHPELSMTVKKQEIPAYDPRTSFTQALGYEMSNRGACHLEGGYTAAKDYCAGYAEWPGDRIEGSALISKNAALGNTTVDIIGACVYSSFSITLDEYALLVNAVTGLSYNAGLLQKIAWRTLTLERLFNIRCGFTKDDDWLPARFFETPVDTRERIAVCNRTAFEQMHQEYYQAMGWDDQGIPTQDTINKLELQDFVQNSLELSTMTDIRYIYEKLYLVGAALARINANNTHSGNLSMRDPDDPDLFYITASGSQCGALIPRDIVPIKFSDVSWGDARGSTESTIHRKILQIPGASAIVHAHSIQSTMISFDTVDTQIFLRYLGQDHKGRDEFEFYPLDLFGAYTLGAIKVGSYIQPVGSPEMEERIPKYLEENIVTIVRGHGPFTIGRTPEEGLHRLSVLEHSATLAMNLRRRGVKIIELQRILAEQGKEKVFGGGAVPHQFDVNPPCCDITDQSVIEDFRQRLTYNFGASISAYGSGSMSQKVKANEMIYCPMSAVPEGFEFPLYRLKLDFQEDDSIDLRFHKLLYQNTHQNTCMITTNPLATSEGMVEFAEMYGMAALSGETVEISYELKKHPVVCPIDAEAIYLNPRLGLVDFSQMKNSTADNPILNMLRWHKGCCIVAGYGVISTGDTTLEQAAHNASSAERIAQFRTDVFIHEKLLNGPPMKSFENKTV